MDLRINARGNILCITGKNADKAKNIIESLIESVKDKRIISQGYNGFLPGCPHKSIVIDNHEQATVHAEQNAIADCAKRGVSCCGATAYISHYPCVNCIKILSASGIKDILYIDDYKNDTTVEKIADMASINITKI